VASGIYPLHLLSKQKLPQKIFDENDEVLFKVKYRRTKNEGIFFELYPSNFPDFNLYFTVPRLILEKYRNSIGKFKKDFLEWIDIPITIGKTRRILRFKLDIEWLNRIQ